MKFVNLIGKSRSSVYAEFFASPGFKGSARSCTGEGTARTRSMYAG
jgi:hypothetical protein